VNRTDVAIPKPTHETIKAAGDVRVSTKEQTEGDSPSTQRESIKKFAKAQGWKLIDIYEDAVYIANARAVAKRHPSLPSYFP
jgi:DNA invertase Pin-like site-specific DNA recombinase